MLILLFFAVPFVELAVVIAVGSRIGVFDTILVLVLVSVVGAFLAKRQGLGVLREIRRQLDRGQMPGSALTDGLLVLVAATLLLTPGFLTDAVALLLLLPFVRASLRGGVRRWFERRVQVQNYGVVDLDPDRRRDPRDRPDPGDDLGR